MKKLLVALVLALLLALPVFASAVEYEVILPDDYETSGLNYPTLYIMPEDGYASDESGLGQKFSDTQMILVRPIFSQGENIYDSIAQIIVEVDGTYRTIEGGTYRAVVGTGVGGYLAYAAALEDRRPFGAVASIRGNFVGEDNPWFEQMGSVMQRMEVLHMLSEKSFDTIYTYMDAPVDDAWTNMPGSTSDMGALFIEYGTGSAFHEFTVRPGAYDDAFLNESVARVRDRLMTRMTYGLMDGTVAPEKTTLTSADEKIQLNYVVNVTDVIGKYVTGETEMRVHCEIYDDAGEVGSSETHITVNGTGEYAGVIEMDNVLRSNSSAVTLSVEIFGTDTTIATCVLILATDPVADGEYQQIELMGDWNFNYVGAKTVLDVAALTKEETDTWSIVQPGITSWTNGFGNISEKNVASAYGPDYFNYFIVGSGYYAKTFTVPENFDAKEFVLSIGYVDDRCEVFLNGVKVGATGMDDNGQPTGETTWAVFSYFDVDPALLNIGGENTVVVRAWNDLPYGAGGWYGGPIGLYSKAAFASKYDPDGNPRFYEETFETMHASAAQGQFGVVENEYMIYLPKSYATSDRNYPTVYLLHQFNSDHTSYKADGIDRLMDLGASGGVFDEMIVVIPNSSEESWWAGEWEKMITEELIPHIDSNYRTIQDARYRLTAGCSMGGQGAMGVALRNPDLFSGAVSFYGAFSYGGANSPNAIAAQESAEYMNYFALSFICGNQDSYGFGVPAIELNQQLEKMGVEHFFLIDNGGHDSSFYVPYFGDSFGYVRENMFKSDEAAAALLGGSLTIEGTTVKAEMTVDAAISAYMNVIPASSYTKNAAPALSIPMAIEVVKDGELVASFCARDVALTAEQLTAAVETTLEIPVGATVTLKAQLFDRVVTLAQIEN